MRSDPKILLSSSRVFAFTRVTIFVTPTPELVCESVPLLLVAISHGVQYGPGPSPRTARMRFFSFSCKSTGSVQTMWL